MIEELKDIENHVLADLLKNPSIWNTLDVNYHKPRVERLWTQVGESRLMLHVIHPCAPGESLYHPHPWPSAMHVLKGRYEMGLGIRHTPGIKEIQEMMGGRSPLIDCGKDEHDIKVFIKQICKIEMNGDNHYEMLENKGWHFVRPVDEICYSLMLIGKPFEEKDDQDIPKKWGKLPELEEDRKLDILRIFREIIRLSNVGEKIWRVGG